jgi:outer membrane translocation and assembly module TamA
MKGPSIYMIKATEFKFCLFLIKFYSKLQAEYRQYFWRRFGFVVFGGLGNVSNQLISFDFSTMKYSYGAGLRFLFNKNQKINLRMDIGFGQDGNRGIYFGIEEAF